MIPYYMMDTTSCLYLTIHNMYFNLEISCHDVQRCSQLCSLGLFEDGEGTCGSLGKGPARVFGVTPHGAPCMLSVGSDEISWSILGNDDS